VSPIAARREPRVPSREELDEKIKGRLLRRGLPRLQMSVLLALTGATGFLGSFLLLKLGVGSMTLRYPVAVALAYGVFLLLLRLWLKLQSDGWGDAADLGMEVLENCDLVLSGDLDLPAGSGGFASHDGGSGFDLSFDLDDSTGILVVIALLIVAVAALGAVFWILWIAPALLAEVLVDGLVIAALYRRLRQPQPYGWLAGAIRRTCVPALLVALLLSVSGALLHRAAPEARSIGVAWKAAIAERKP